MSLASKRYQICHQKCIIWSFKERIEIQSSLKPTILYCKNLPHKILVDFHVLACSSVKFQPILDFLGSADSQDPEDFKTGLKKAKQGHTKAVHPVKVCPSNFLSPVMISLMV